MGFSAALFLRNCAAAMFGLVVLSSCTVAVDEGSPGPGPQYCTREYNPVCARRDGDRRTFSNGCLANRAGYDVIRRGECRSDGGGGNDQPRFCTREYNPVCARRGGERRTFSNGCVAEQAGYDVVRQGECRGDGGSGGNDGPRMCTQEYRPVCARRDGAVRTFGNECEADAAGWRVVQNRPC